MLKYPTKMPRKAAMAVVCHVERVATSSNGSGANHMSGHHGWSPVPNQIRIAVQATARALRAKATEVPLEGATVERAEPRGGWAQAAAEVEHDEAVGEGAHLE